MSWYRGGVAVSVRATSTATSAAVRILCVRVHSRREFEPPSGPLGKPVRFDELDYQQTPLGELTLWRREAPVSGDVVYEVRLAGEFLMSSRVNRSEIALADLALAELGDRSCDVLVGGLGLGYTARAALAFPNVRSVTVVELLAPVVDWHRKGLVPLGAQLCADPRCRLLQADFFDLIGPPEGDAPRAGIYDAVLVDIDHSTEDLLQPAHSRFYTARGVAALGEHLRPGGIFSFWSADPPREAFMIDLRAAFSSVRIEEVTFRNPHMGTEDTNFVLLATRGG